MIIFIDFDDVLFNTKQFKCDLQKLFLGYGIDEELFEKTYYENPFGGKKRVIYKLTEHVNRISKFVELNKRKLFKDIDNFFASTQKYVFDDVIPFLKNNQVHELHLLTFGMTEFQNTKINNSGIGRYFKEIIIVDGPKSKYINQVLSACESGKEARAVFADDRVEFISDVKKNCSGIITILIDRPEGRYHDKPEKSCDWVAHSFFELEGIIKNLKN